MDIQLNIFGSCKFSWKGTWYTKFNFSSKIFNLNWIWNYDLSKINNIRGTMTTDLSWFVTWIFLKTSRSILTYGILYTSSHGQRGYSKGILVQFGLTRGHGICSSLERYSWSQSIFIHGVSFSTIETKNSKRKFWKFWAIF